MLNLVACLRTPTSCSYFRNRTQAAADLLRELEVQLPEYDNVHIESSDFRHC